MTSCFHNKDDDIMSITHVEFKRNSLTHNYPYKVKSAQLARAINNNYVCACIPAPTLLWLQQQQQDHPHSRAVPCRAMLTQQAQVAPPLPCPKPWAYWWLSIVHGSSGCAGSCLRHGGRRRGVGVVWLLVGSRGPLDGHALDAGSNRLAKKLSHLLAKVGKCLGGG